MLVLDGERLNLGGHVCNALIQPAPILHQAADLVGRAGALTDQAQARAMQSQKIHLLWTLMATKTWWAAAPPQRWLRYRGNRSCGL
jgi:hypothetical protein